MIDQIKCCDLYPANNIQLDKQPDKQFDDDR